MPTPMTSRPEMIGREVRGCAVVFKGGGATKGKDSLLPEGVALVFANPETGEEVTFSLLGQEAKNLFAFLQQRDAKYPGLFSEEVLTAPPEIG